MKSLSNMVFLMFFLLARRMFPLMSAFVVFPAGTVSGTSLIRKIEIVYNEQCFQQFTARFLMVDQIFRF